MSNFSFDLLKQDNSARLGLLKTPHGDITTPIFMPVGTCASVKSLCPNDLNNAQSQIILGNTYHLMLRPGSKLIKELGGLHKFMSWSKPILTDSGGFQVFSLSQDKDNERNNNTNKPKKLATIDDDGVTFRSYIDGSIHRMTPEISMQIQMDLGADIIMAFDQCPPGNAARETIKKAMARTTSWLKRCINTMNRDSSRLFAIIQGGIHEDLRKQHTQELLQYDQFGYAIGGLSVGEAKEDMWPACTACTDMIPQNKPRYLMGVGTPDDLLEAIACGVDMFDCVMPSRNARNGCLFTHSGKVLIKSARFKNDQSSLDEQCTCYTCQTFTKAYLRHLFCANELLYYRLATLHNITYYISLISDAKKAIQNGDFVNFKKYRNEQHSNMN